MRVPPLAAASALLLLSLGPALPAQQVPDLDFKPPVRNPAYTSGPGPRVAIDGAHHNFHTADGRFAPFAELLRRDGYRVTELKEALSAAALRAVDILVIANPLHAQNLESWDRPNPAAFSAAETAALLRWVRQGGALFLIVDHMPFPGAAGSLAQAFGVTFSNGFAVRKGEARPTTFLFSATQGLPPSAAIQGRAESERVTQVATFVGSAFKAPRGAIPVLAFDAGYESLEPARAWVFQPDTPRIDLQGWCQGALLKEGRGRVAVFGEAAMFTAQLAGPARLQVGMNAPEAKQNAQLVLNLLHWLSRAAGMPD